MEAIYLEHGFLYYYGNRAGYQKGDLVYVDPIFYTSFLKESLAKMGRYPKEQEGLYERLLNCQVRSDDGKCRLQFCRIWQWREEVLPEKKFLPFSQYAVSSKLGEADSARAAGVQFNEWFKRRTSK